VSSLSRASVLRVRAGFMELAVPLASREAREVAGDCLLGFFFSSFWLRVVHVCALFVLLHKIRKL